MSQLKDWRETISVLKEALKPSLQWARDTLGAILRDNLGEGNRKLTIVARQWGDKFCRRETSRCLAWPSGFVGPGRLLETDILAFHGTL